MDIAKKSQPDCWDIESARLAATLLTDRAAIWSMHARPRHWPISVHASYPKPADMFQQNSV
jgi:hypothetical protein